MTSGEKDIRSFGFDLLDQELHKKKSIIESFTYNCSHGIRSPLKSMAGLVRLMKDYPRTEDWQDCRDLLEQAAKRMQSILDNFHQLKLNSTQAPNADHIVLRKMLDSIIVRLRRTSIDENLNIRIYINQKGEFFSDKARLEAILDILISNAIVFSDLTKTERHISIYITSSSVSCSIQVHDNGIGIESKDCDKIFDLFFRGDTRSTGAGMGLYIARQLTKKLEGTLTVQSTPGIRTIFSLWIPNMRSTTLAQHKPYVSIDS
jgi:signal transduction histidine kinase